MGSHFKRKAARIIKRVNARQDRRQLGKGLRQQVGEILAARAEPVPKPELGPVVNAFHSDMFVPLQEFRLKQG